MREGVLLVPNNRYFIVIFVKIKNELLRNSKLELSISSFSLAEILFS
jgi:hypothetical protein